MAGLALAAALTISAAVSATALAAGPVWRIEGTELGAGESANVRANSKTAFTLKAGSLITIVCGKATATGTIDGGEPGTDNSKITFAECVVKGDESTCHVNSPKAKEGTIETEAKTELVFLNKEETKVGDLFTPESGSTFVELDVAGTKCPSLTKGTNKVEGSVAAEVKPVGEEVKIGELIFPTKAIKSVVRAGGSEVSVGITVFGIIEAVLNGETSVELESGKAFGVLPAWGKIVLKNSPWQAPAGGAGVTFLAEYQGSGEAKSISVEFKSGAFLEEGSADPCEGKPGLLDKETCEVKIKCVGTKGATAPIFVKSTSTFVSDGDGTLECT